jgi:ADP-ribose 1''-phosphate phosphatase
MDELQYTTLANSVTGEEFSTQRPLGTALIIPPQESDYAGRNRGKKHWIVCLFTSYGFGKRVASRPEIMEYTLHSVRDLRQQLMQLLEDGEEVGKLYSCRFNSGLFNVPWKESRVILQQELHGIPGMEEVIVVRPEGEED